MLTEIETRPTTSFNKNLNIPYVYSVTVFLDDRSGKRTYKCHMIGELDEAGSIVPTRSKRPADRQKRDGFDSNCDYQALCYEAIKQLEMMKASDLRTTVPCTGGQSAGL